MQADMKPIIFNTPPEFEEIEIYAIHDLHYGNRQFNLSKWKKLKEEIMSEPNRYCVMVGDMMEMAIPGSKSDCFYQTVPPEAQKEWVAYEMGELADRIIAVVSGNHEHNRATKICGLYPLYDACCWARIQDRYRENFAVVDIAIGKRRGTLPRQYHYVGFLTHKARDLKGWSTVDTLEGFDFMVYGHDHDPKEHARGHLVYDTKNKVVTTKSIETVNAGSFLEYGDYAARAAYRPPSDKLYKLVLCPNRDDKLIRTVGFYL
jgi:predicted MPP superfamily phosphohydrolase